MRIAYVPVHAEKNICHKDVEKGTAVSVAETTGLVFVKFDEEVKEKGWENVAPRTVPVENIISI